MMELRIPVKRAGLSAYWRHKLTTSGIGIVLTIIMGLACVYSAYYFLNASAHRVIWAINLVLSLLIACSIGFVTWPIWQQAQALSRTLLNDAPAVSVSRDGIEDNASDTPLGLIRWEKIEDVTASARYSQSAKKSFGGLVIVFKDRMQASRRPILQSVGMTLKYRSKRGIFIPQGRIAMPVEEVVEKINDFRARLKA